MAWKIELDKSAEKELKKLDKQTAIRILKFLHERISKSEDPRSIGEALKGSALGDYWGRLRKRKIKHVKPIADARY